MSVKDNFRHLPQPDPNRVVMIVPSERETDGPAFAGLTAILYVLATALDVDNAERIAELFSERLGTKTIVTEIPASYLAQIVRDARG